MWRESRAPLFVDGRHNTRAARFSHPARSLSDGSVMPRFVGLGPITRPADRSSDAPAVFAASSIFEFNDLMDAETEGAVLTAVAATTPAEPCQSGALVAHDAERAGAASSSVQAPVLGTAQTTAPLRWSPGPPPSSTAMWSSAAAPVPTMREAWPPSRTGPAAPLPLPPPPSQHVAPPPKRPGPRAPSKRAGPKYDELYRKLQWITTINQEQIAGAFSKADLLAFLRHHSVFLKASLSKMDCALELLKLINAGGLARPSEASAHPVSLHPPVSSAPSSDPPQQCEVIADSLSQQGGSDLDAKGAHKPLAHADEATLTPVQGDQWSTCHTTTASSHAPTLSPPRPPPSPSPPSLPNEAASPLEPPQAPQAHAAHDTHLAPNSLEPPACCITPAHADSVSLKTPETLPMGDEELQLVSRLRSSAKPQWPDLGALLLDFNRLPTASSMPSVPHNIIDAVVASPGVTESAHRASPPSDQSACIPPSTAAAPNMTPAPAETDSVGSSAFALSAASLAAIERAVPPSQPQAKPPTLGPAALEAPRRAVGDHPHAPTTPAAVQLLPCEAQQSPTSKPGPHLSQTGTPSAENVANMIAKVRSLVRGASDEQITSALARTSHNLSRAVELVKAAVASAAFEKAAAKQLAKARTTATTREADIAPDLALDYQTREARQCARPWFASPAGPARPKKRTASELSPAHASRRPQCPRPCSDQTASETEMSDGGRHGPEEEPACGKQDQNDSVGTQPENSQSLLCTVTLGHPQPSSVPYEPEPKRHIVLTVFDDE